ncbi:methyltransferase domain-containing protein [Magnetospirillum sp. 15-1]|uniref:class I SAM-dependent methyltransferase n=1 Tax=Magnetospirillum sp. 15-1 TaxID=1979370 RepID=UPI000BBC8AD7|nr:methyltransferase domain-containing protein [Magnetospirillum sp. 15-1]
MTRTRPTLHCPCERRTGATSFTYDAAPAGETAFDLKGQDYRRTYWRCGICRHEFSDHELDLSGLYGGAYVEQTYGPKMRATFERIIALPPERSDNAGRVRRVVDFAVGHFAPGIVPRLLDIGAGLGVFPHGMKQAGWNVTALDPDPQAGRHLTEVVGVRAVTADFFAVDAATLGPFDVITLNKVIEHVEAPVPMLAKAGALLAAGGFVYVEVPDVVAAIDGPGREEYFIEHHHVFSHASLAMTAERAGLAVMDLERLREPSGKFTLRGFFAGTP